LPPSLLKNADEQTVAGVAAVLQAIAVGGLSTVRFTEWGVLAAPRFLGRWMFAHVLQRYATEGAWGVSPHLIPNRSLHSISGAVSLVLKIHGPNFGVGGGPSCLLEVLRTGTAMLHGDRLPGVWVVLTGWDPEPIPNGKGGGPENGHCVGLALALTAARSGWRGARLRLVPATRAAPFIAEPQESARPNLLNLAGLMQALAAPALRTASVVWHLDDGGRFELERGDMANWAVGPHAWPASGSRVTVGSSGAGAENLL
jgi:hypothetical protein